MYDIFRKDDFMKKDEIISDIEDAMTSDALKLSGISLFEVTDAERKANDKLDELLQKYLPKENQQDNIMCACSKVTRVHEQEAFNAGFKLGARLILEILD